MSIYVAKAYVPILDAIYKNASKTAILDGDTELVRAGANAGEICVPKISMQGLASYSRTAGYTSGTVDLEWETIKADYERSRKFSVDKLDDSETQNTAFGKLAGEFIRTKVVPELDAMRLSKYASTANIGSATAALSTAADYMAALRVAADAMDDYEVSEDDRVLFINPTGIGLIEDMDTTKSRRLLERFSEIVKVPQTRMYSKITLYDGTTSGQEGGGYIKDATTGKNLNFIIVAKSAVSQFNKHVAPKVIEPESNQDGDQYIYAYRVTSVAQVYDNKLKGVYAHISTT